jgi:ABC-type transport system substrate-binding protein
MTRRPKWLSLASLGAAAALVASVSAAGVAQSLSPSAAPYPEPLEQPPAPTADITEYPNYGGDVDCEAGTFNGLPYAGNLKKITAPDAQTVVFEFCNPNVAFLLQVAFASLGIDDAQYLIDHMADGSILEQPNGTGPYMLDSWERGNRLVMTANENYWGEHKALTPGLEFRWSDQSAQRLVELQAGAVDGIDNPGKDDLPAIEADSNVVLYPRAGMNTFYLGMNNRFEPWDDVRVRQAVAMGVDRQRLVDAFMPPGSEVASFFTPCEPLVPFACEGEAWHEFDPEGARALLAEAGVEEGTPIKLQYRAAVRPYLADPPTVAQDVASQLETNLGFDVTIEEQESGTFLDNNAAGTLDGIFLLGWGADYADPTNFLDYHFGSGAGDKFGDPIPELVEVLNNAGQSADNEERVALYTEANNLIRENVPMALISHGATGTVFRADVEGAHSSPLTTEVFAVMQAADRDTLVFMQNAEPLSLYCGDETDGETLRPCEQMKESLYAYEVAGTEAVPSLATECTPNEDLTVWTCTLREGVTFHDGSTFEASDVIVSYAAQWDTLSPLHVGRTAAFEYWPSLVGGGFLNPPAPAS